MSDSSSSQELGRGKRERKQTKRFSEDSDPETAVDTSKSPNTQDKQRRAAYQKIEDKKQEAAKLQKQRANKLAASRKRSEKEKKANRKASKQLGQELAQDHRATTVSSDPAIAVREELDRIFRDIRDHDSNLAQQLKLAYRLLPVDEAREQEVLIKEAYLPFTPTFFQRRIAAQAQKKHQKQIRALLLETLALIDKAAYPEGSLKFEDRAWSPQQSAQ